MAETKAQKIARLRREIDEAEAGANSMLQRAEAKREKLEKIKNRPSEPEGEMFAVRVRFTSGPVVYNYLMVRTSRGWFTTGTGSRSFMHSWDEVIDWLDGEDVAWHSGVERLTGTGEIALPSRASDYFDV